MRIVESIIKYFLFIALSYSTAYILLDQRGLVVNQTMIDNFPVNGYTLLGCLLVAAFFTFVSPMWDVGKYLGTQNVEEIGEFIRKYKRVFGMYVFGFLGDIFLCGSPLSFPWWIGIMCVAYFYIWFFLMRNDSLHIFLTKKSNGG